MDLRRKYAWLALAGYFSLALAIPALTPAPRNEFSLPPIASLVLAENSAEDDAMMGPLRAQASAALHDLQAAAARNTAKVF
jgi:hypothetical protein